MFKVHRVYQDGIRQDQCMNVCLRHAIVIIPKYNLDLGIPSEGTAVVKLNFTVARLSLVT